MSRHLEKKRPVLWVGLAALVVSSSCALHSSPPFPAVWPVSARSTASGGEQPPTGPEQLSWASVVASRSSATVASPPLAAVGPGAAKPLPAVLRPKGSVASKRGGGRHQRARAPARRWSVGGSSGGSGGSGGSGPVITQQPAAVSTEAAGRQRAGPWARKRAEPQQSPATRRDWEAPEAALERFSGQIARASHHLHGTPSAPALRRRRRQSCPQPDCERETKAAAPTESDGVWNGAPTWAARTASPVTKAGPAAVSASLPPLIPVTTGKGTPAPCALGNCGGGTADATQGSAAEEHGNTAAGGRTGFSEPRKTRARSVGSGEDAGSATARTRRLGSAHTAHRGAAAKLAKPEAAGEEETMETPGEASGAATGDRASRAASSLAAVDGARGKTATAVAEAKRTAGAERESADEEEKGDGGAGPGNVSISVGMMKRARASAPFCCDAHAPSSSSEAAAVSAERAEPGGAGDESDGDSAMPRWRGTLSGVRVPILPPSFS